MAREDASGENRLVAYLVPTPGPDPNAADLRRALLETLPEYMVPSAFVVLEALPLTPNGKVDRKALPEPDAARTAAAEAYVPPRGPIEEALAAIWAELLGRDRVGVHDNFFDLGGHSLIATQLLARVRGPVRRVAGPERVLRRPHRGRPGAPGRGGAAGRGRASRPRRSGRPTDRRRSPPRSRSSGSGSSTSSSRAAPFYNIPVAVRLVGALDADALKRSLDEIVRRHEVLRTTFAAVDGRPVQVIAPSLEVALPVEDLSASPEDRREAEAERLVREESCAAVRPGPRPA